MTIDVVTDYAEPLMNIERMAKKVHHLCLENKYAEAKELAIQIAVEAKLLQSVLILMEEKKW